MMKIVIETYRLLMKMGTFKAYSTVEIVEMTKRQRCAVLKRLHRLEAAGLIEKRLGQDGGFFWKVIKVPEKPTPPTLWKEPKSIYEMNGTTPPSVEDDEGSEESTSPGDNTTGSSD